MATYLSLVEPTLKAVKYIYDAGKGMSENAHECRQFSEHAKLVLNLMKKQARQSPGAKPSVRVVRLCEKLVEIQRTIQGLSKKSWLHRLLWHGDISTQIHKAYDEVDRVVQLLGLAGTVDILRMQRENEVARRRDATAAQQNIDRLLRSNKDILECLQVSPPQIEEAKLAVRKNLPYVTAPKQRQVLQRGLEDLERRSRDVKTLPERFIITSLDVIIHEDLKLGSGGYSQVYAASWHGSRVAVKVLEKGMSQSLMDREINVWKDLRHPNILALYGACSLADPPFMVCEYKANGNAVEYLRKFPDADRCQLLLEASLGLVYLHQNKVIHGDIKGTNILIDHAGRACLADFGLSKIKLYSSTLHAKNSKGETQGTIRWMAPEQIKHGELSTKTDIWSFAMTIYELFTGYPPFSGAPEHAVQFSLSGRGNARPLRPDDPRIATLGLSDTMWSLVRCCWDQSPPLRMSARQLSQQLQMLAQDFRDGVMSSRRIVTRQNLRPPAQAKTDSEPTVISSRPTTEPINMEELMLIAGPPPPMGPPPTMVPPPTMTEPLYPRIALTFPPGFTEPRTPPEPAPYYWQSLPYSSYKDMSSCNAQASTSYANPFDSEAPEAAYDRAPAAVEYTYSSSRSSSRNVSKSSRTNVTRTVLKIAEEAESRSSGRTKSTPDLRVTVSSYEGGRRRHR